MLWGSVLEFGAMQWGLPAVYVVLLMDCVHALCAIDSFLRKVFILADLISISVLVLRHICSVGISANFLSCLVVISDCGIWSC